MRNTQFAALLCAVGSCAAFRSAQRRRPPPAPCHPRVASTRPLRMGLFDMFADAFKNEDYSRADRRVRAKHVLVADRDRCVELLDEIAAGAAIEDVARRESTCASASKGGDLGSFGPGKMVAQFDRVLFPDEDEPPPVGSLIGPVETQFGFHVILVTERDSNK
eukprot:CAMPEP_0119284224 /NCGR_PEP_ID=MMETSP1329-20130426/29939_1 /TAXON_ID=114041 /ORGANISM="Genus nov. species nov., Strain RCC1024" /LENGTH=162 /DNA_ID=CAMNT_0007284901 /DNA_START=289 /DNA_END=774 /DNA_ORIENTATION=-